MKTVFHEFGMSVGLRNISAKDWIGTEYASLK